MYVWGRGGGGYFVVYAHVIACRDTKITQSVAKMLRVWKERKVYNSSFVASLLAVLEGKDRDHRGSSSRIRSSSIGEHGFKVCLYVGLCVCVCVFLCVCVCVCYLYIVCIHLRAEVCKDIYLRI